MTEPSGRNLAEKVAIVTGGSNGYGAGIAEALARKGADVWITGRDESALRAVAEPLGMNWRVADVTDAGAWDALIASVMQEHGRIDILVNNAGAGVQIKPIDEQADAAIADSISTNLTSHLLGCRRVAAIMKRQRDGLIINISSVCAEYAWAGWSVYSAAKAGINQFSRCLDAELRSLGVRVTCLSPSWGATGFLSSAELPARDAATRDQCIKPEELGDLVTYVATMPAHLITSNVTLWPSVQLVEPL